MKHDKIVLTAKDILEKPFKTDTRGYRPQEVDSFLDIIIRDYVEYEKVFDSLMVENEKLTEEIKNLNQEIRVLNDSMEVMKEGTKEITNLDILRRISNLEKKVYDE